MRPPGGRRRLLAGAVSAVTTLGVLAGVSPSALGAEAHASRPAAVPVKPTVVYRHLALPNGDTATVYSDGLAAIASRHQRSAEYQQVPPAGGVPGTASALPARPELVWELTKGRPRPFVPGEFEVVLAPPATATLPSRVVPTAALTRLRAATSRPGGLPTGPVPAYTTNGPLNRVLAGLGVADMKQVFRGASRTALGHASPGGLDLGRAYVVHVTNASMQIALTALRKSPAVAYASPDWTVAPMNTTATPLPAAARQAAAALAGRLRHRAAAPPPGNGLAPLPGNFALQTSAQSLLNRPATDWAPAYEALQNRYHQLPGTGETITDVSLGDLTSADIGSDDPCFGLESAFGPTTVINNGQRYLDWPSMPLIPTWTASDASALDPTGEVCGVDPFDTEIGLDFAMMAPLPDSAQRPGAMGSGLTDLLGIAPGASFRLVVPSDTSGSITSIDAALLAAAQQSPRPDVITASLGFGLDSQGFPSRYLEDDPLTEQLVSSLVHQDHITVSISANDGLRPSTNAPVSPSGGSAATDLVPAGGTPTSLNDMQFSTAPSRDPDSGAIDAGGVTLDDIAAAPPQDPALAPLSAQQAFPSVRWDGSANFSSGFGGRVNLSAPGDDVIGFEHTFGGAASDVTPVNIGGTSASAQEIGAEAAVTQQAARLSGNHQIATDPLALRAYLERTGTPVPNVPQADQPVNVGPQADLGRAVTGLLGPGPQAERGVARVAVAQRQPLNSFDTQFVTATDPGAISLAGANQNAWVTVAPDWVGLPPGARYLLTASTASGGRSTLATGPWARLQPDAILAAAGLQPSTQNSQTVTLNYTASAGAHVLAQAAIPLTFTPVSGSPQPLAPLVPAVTTGPGIPVHYDLSGQTGFTDPVLVVSAPGRMTPLDSFFRPVYSEPLTATSGTVTVPVSALQGAGVYGIAIQANPATPTFSDFAFTRVQDTPSDAQPAAPLLSAPGSPPGHLLTIPYGGHFTVTWDVTGVPRATGAALEISSGGPTRYGSFAPFNNPNGSVRDANGHDSSSVYFARLPGARGSVTLSGTEAGLFPAMYHSVRVLPLMGNGTAAGEASDVSSITENGVAAPDGSFAKCGFGVDAHGDDGLLTTTQFNSCGVGTASSAYTFSQATNAVTGTLASSPSGADQYTTANQAGPGIFAGDVGLLADNLTSSPFTTRYTAYSPLSSGKVAGTWTPPDAPLGAQVQPADNQDTPTTALMIGNFIVGFRVLTTNIAANTFGPSYSLSPVLSSFGFPQVTGFAQDTATNTAVVGASDLANSSAPPTLITVDLGTGALHTITGVGTQSPLGLTVDPATDTAVMPTANNPSIGFYNLANGTATQVTPGGANYQYPAHGNGEFLIEEASSPDASLRTAGIGLTPNNDSLSSVLVLNQQGQVVQRIEHFNDFNFFSASIGDFLQLNPGTRTGYTLGPNGQQLVPFSYDGS
jgi:hypothetical protein